MISITTKTIPTIYCPNYDLWAIGNRIERLQKSTSIEDAWNIGREIASDLKVISGSNRGISFVSGHLLLNKDNSDNQAKSLQTFIWGLGKTINGESPRLPVFSLLPFHEVFKKHCEEYHCDSSHYPEEILRKFIQPLFQRYVKDLYLHPDWKNSHGSVWEEEYLHSLDKNDSHIIFMSQEFVDKVSV